jgi:hypothetical protein
MKGLDYHFGCMLADYLDAPEEPETEPELCPFCGAECTDNDDCTNPDCPEQ